MPVGFDHIMLDNPGSTFKHSDTVSFKGDLWSKKLTIYLQIVPGIIPQENNVGDLELISLADEVPERLQRLLDRHADRNLCFGNREPCGEQNIPDVIIPCDRCEFYGNVVSKDFHKHLQYLEAESRSVFDATSPFISALVGSIVKKLSNEISTSTVYYDVLKLAKRITIR